MTQTYTAEVKELEGNAREVEITFPDEVVSPRLEEKLTELRGRVRLPGFRPGRVPMQMIRKMFLKDVLADVALDLAEGSLPSIEQEHQLRIVGRPELLEHQYSTSEGLRIRLRLEVFPEFELPDFASLKVERPVVQVTDEDVEQQLELLRRREAIELEVEDGAKEGDILVCTVKEVDPSGVPLVGREPREIVLRLPASDANEEDAVQVREQLLGVKPGETRRITLTSPLFPEQRDTVGTERYGYSVEVQRVVRRELPDLDDEFAKDVGDFKTLDELREALKRRLESEAEQYSQRKFFENIRRELIKSTDFVPPEVFVHRILKGMMKDYRQSNPEVPVPESDLAKQLRPRAVEVAKWLMIREKILEEHGLGVSEDDIDVYIEDLVKANPDRADEIRKLYESDDARSNLRYDLEGERISRFLASQVQTVDVPERLFQGESEEKEFQEAAEERRLIRTPYEVMGNRKLA